MKQLPLPFAPHRSYAAEDLLPDTSNAAALAWLATPERWPLHRLALFGPEGVGKTHMLHATANREGWTLLEGPLLRGLPPPPRAGIALDDADAVPDEAALFHLINLCAETGVPLLLAGREAPARWRVNLPDLVSRLRATAAVEVAPPSEDLLAALLEKHFADRQLRTDPGFRAWLLPRLPREAAAVAEAAARLDRAALAAQGTKQGRITRALARDCLAPLLDEKDHYVTEPAPVSPTGGTLL
jgi:chromosomal replication initiation ATPase DnaA